MREISYEQLESRETIVLNYYDILENDDHEFLITSPVCIPGLKDEPTFYYGGGQHAILMKNAVVSVICDYVHPGVRERLLAVPEVLIAELPKGTEVVLDEYMATVVQMDVDEWAERLMEKDDVINAR